MTYLVLKACIITYSNICNSTLLKCFDNTSWNRWRDMLRTADLHVISDLPYSYVMDCHCNSNYSHADILLMDHLYNYVMLTYMESFTESRRLPVTTVMSKHFSRKCSIVCRNNIVLIFINFLWYMQNSRKKILKTQNIYIISYIIIYKYIKCIINKM